MGFGAMHERFGSESEDSHSSQPRARIGSADELVHTAVGQARSVWVAVNIVLAHSRARFLELGASKHASAAPGGTYESHG